MLPSVIDGLRPSKEPEPSPLPTPHSMGRSGTFKKGARIRHAENPFPERHRLPRKPVSENAPPLPAPRYHR
jgi:hypothetical protein